MIKNLQGMLSPSKKKRSFQPDQHSVVDEYSRASVTTTPKDGKNGRLMNVLKSPPIDDDAKESSPGVLFARRRRSITGDEPQISPSYEDAEKKAGLNIRGFFTRRKSMSKKESEEMMVHSPSNVVEDDDSENDIEQSYLEEIFKRKQAAMQEEISESQYSAAESNVVGDNKSRRGRRRSVTKLMAESRRRDEEKSAGVSPGGGLPVVLDNISRRRRRSLHARPLDAPSRREDTDAMDERREPNLVRQHRASVSSVENATAEVTEKRTYKERGSADVQASPNRNSHKKEDVDDRRRMRGRESQISRSDIENDLLKNDRRKSHSQKIMRDPGDKYSYSESEADRKSHVARNTEQQTISAGDKRSSDNFTKSRGGGHDQRRNSVVSDKGKMRDRHTRDRSRSPPSGPIGRSRSKSRNHAKSPTRHRSKSRRRRSELEESRERRRSKSRHRSLLVSPKSNDDEHRRQGSSSNMHRDPDRARERETVERVKIERDIHNVREGSKGKDYDRQRERDREENRRRRYKDNHIPRDPRNRESGKGARRSRRANDDHSSARSFLSDSASSFDSFSQQSRTGSTSSTREETLRGGHASPHGKMSKSKDKLKSYLPSDERARSKQSLDMRSPSTISSKQKIDLRKFRTEGSGKHMNPWTEKDLPEVQSHHSRNSDACHESFSNEIAAIVAKNEVGPEKTYDESNNSSSNAKITATADRSAETGRTIAQDKNGTIRGGEKLNNEHSISGPDPPSDGKRSRNRRVALASILDSDVGGEREADILSLCSSYSKPLVTARTLYHSELLVKVPDDRGGLLSSDRYKVLSADSGTRDPLLHHSMQDVPDSAIDKPQESCNTANGSSSSLNHEVTDTKQLIETDHNSEINCNDDENVTVAEHAVCCEPALFAVANGEAEENFLRDSRSIKLLQSHDIDLQPTQYDFENDKLSAELGKFNDALSMGGEETLPATKETEQRTLTASSKKNKSEDFQSSTSAPPSYFCADKDMEKPLDSEKMQQNARNVDFGSQINPDKTNRTAHDDNSEKSLELELLSETNVRPEGPGDSIQGVSSTRDVSTAFSSTHPSKQYNLATTTIEPANQGLTPIVELSRDKSHEAAEARISLEALSSEPSQNSILSSPVSSRGRDRSRKSVKGASKKGDKYGRTNLQSKDIYHDSSDNRSLSPKRRSSENKVSSDASSRDSKTSSWRPPKPNERGTDESNKTSQMRRRRSSRRMDSHREVNKNDATSVEYNEEDVFTLYKWSGTRQAESKVRGERLALRKSIKALSFLRAFETVGI